MAVEYLGTGNDDGVVLGRDATVDKVGFYGTTPIVQRSGSAQAAVTATTPTQLSPFGFSSAQATALITLVNEIRAALVAVGLIKGSS